MQINLSALLDMSVEPGSGLYAGFTAATGRAWAKHDVLSWYWCHENSCEEDQTQEWLEVTSVDVTLRTVVYLPCNCDGVLLLWLDVLWCNAVCEYDKNKYDHDKLLTRTACDRMVLL
jgi:hypothetical protein